MTPNELFDKHFHLIERWIRSIKKKGYGWKIEDDDLFQISTMALWITACRWKDGVAPFTACAYQRIRFEVSNYSRKKGTTIEGAEIKDEEINYDTDHAIYMRRLYKESKKAVLTERERQIIDLAIDQDMEIKDIAHQVNLSTERIRQIKLHAFVKIRKQVRHVS